MKAIKSRTLLLVLGHIVNDMSASSLSGLLPVFTGIYGLSFLMAGALGAAFNIASSALQPLLGRWFDRTHVSWLLELGLAITCVGMGLTGICSSYIVLVLLLTIAGVGYATFHPPAFSTVVKSSKSSRGGAVGIFLAGGNAGYFLGPIVAGILVSTMGLPGTLLFLPIGVFTAVFIYRLLERSGKWESGTPKVSQIQHANKRLLIVLATVACLRSTAVGSATIFLPLYFVLRGESLLVATSIASFWLAAGALGQVLVGMSSDHLGRGPIIAASTLVGALSFYGFLTTSGLLSLLLLGVSGLLLSGGWSVIVTTSSEAAPANVAAATGLMLGLSGGVGGLGSLGFGAAADALGLHTAFTIFLAFAIAGGLVALLLPRRAGISGHLRL